MANIVRRLIERGVPVVLLAAHSAPQHHVAHAQAISGSFLCRAADARHPRDLLRLSASKRMAKRAPLGLVREQWNWHPKIMP
jgi:hypothetical protein